MPDLCLYCGLRAAPTPSVQSHSSIYQQFDDKIKLMLRGHHVDTAVVKSAILTIEEHSQSIDDQLKHLEELRHRLLAERSNAAAELARYRSFIAPIRRLPNEILSEIFSFACTVMSDSVDIVGGAPWIFSHVCSLWRSICLSTPHLWSTITILPTSSTRNNVADILGSYLDHSGEKLLNLYLDGNACTTPVDVDFNGHGTNILRILRAHRSRWNRVILLCDRDLPGILDVIDAWERRDPGLNRLRMIKILTLEADDARLFSTRAFSRALNLKSIHLGSGILLEDPSFPHLTHFHGTFSSVLQFRELLESAPSLRDISISYNPSTRTPDVFPPRALTHPNVCKVTVRSSAACFSSVIFPSLEELVIDAGVYESNFDHEHANHLSYLMANSRHTRRSLDMIVLSRSHLTPFLTRDLTSLIIQVSTDTSREVYDALMYDSEGSYPVAPNITHMSIKETALISDPNILTDDACLRMVCSRVTTLQSVVLQVILVFHYSQDVSQLGARPRPLLNDFESLRSSQGLDVRVRWTERTAGIGAENDKHLDLVGGV